MTAAAQPRPALRLTSDELWLLSAARDDVLPVEVETWRPEASDPERLAARADELVRSLLVRGVLVPDDERGFVVDPDVKRDFPAARDCTWKLTVTTMLGDQLLHRLVVLGGAEIAVLLHPVAGGVELLSSSDPTADLARALCTAAAASFGQLRLEEAWDGPVDVESVLTADPDLRAQQVVVGPPHLTGTPVAAWLETERGCQALDAGDGEWVAGSVELEPLLATLHAVATHVEALAASVTEESA